MSNNFGILAIAFGIVLKVAGRNEKPLTNRDIAQGNDMTFNTMGNMSIVIGGAVLVYNNFKKK